MIKKTMMFVFFIFSITSCFAQSKKFYFYHPEQNFGSESVFNPITLYLNGSFDILRNGGHEKRLSMQNFSDNFKTIYKALKDPFPVIKRKGWNEFTKEEFPNFDLKGNNLNFMPNLPIHTIGNGMQFVKVSEWYAFHNYPLPKTLGLLTTISYQVMNEMTEQNLSDKLRTDPIADFWIYNNLGFILFSFDGVKRFFSETFVVNDWSMQPMYNPFNDNIENAGQQYSGKLKINNKLDLFTQWGIDGLIGLSFRIDKDNSFSLAGGTVVNKISYSEEQGIQITKADKIDPAIAVFWDINNSLMFTSHLSGHSNFVLLKTNMFPGIINYKNVSLGIYNAITIKENKFNELLLGISVNKFPVGILKNF